MNGLEILGTGRSLPARTADNSDFTQIVDTSDEWISSRTGMKRRYIASRSEPTWRMGAQAARLALDAAGLCGADISMIIVSTVSSDYYTPSTACMVQRELEAVNAFALDINVACTGFAFSLDMARRYLEDNSFGHIMIIGAESLTQLTNYCDRSTCVLFGDGAGAWVVKAADKKFASFFKSDPAGAHLISAKRPRRKNPFLQEDPGPEDCLPAAPDSTIYMNGREVYKFATRVMPEAVRKACGKLGISVSDLKLVIPHQANARIIETAAKSLGLTDGKMYVNIERYGNTSSASIAIALDECVRGGKIERGDLICIAGFGAGLTYGASVFEY